MTAERKFANVFIGSYASGSIEAIKSRDDRGRRSVGASGKLFLAVKCR